MARRRVPIARNINSDATGIDINNNSTNSTFRKMSDTQMSYPKSVSLKKVTGKAFPSPVTHKK
jgi:hypothetical protein